jgi:WD40 repeat protein
MHRNKSLSLAWLVVVAAGCGEADTGISSGRAPAAPPGIAPLSAPSAAPPVAAPAPAPAVAPASQPPVAPQQPGAPDNQLASGSPLPATIGVFIPFPPFVIGPPPKMPNGGPFAGQQANAGGLGAPVGGVPGSPPGSASRTPQTELEAELGPELFAVAPGGALLATYTVDSSKRPVDYALKLWDLATGRPLVKLESNDILREMAISPDGKLLATVAGDGSELTIWELPAGTKKSNHNWSKYGSLSFANDSNRVVTTTGIKGIAIFDLTTGKATVKRLKNLAKTLVVQASPTEAVIAVGLGTTKRPEEKVVLAPPPAGASKKELAEYKQKRDQQLEAQRQKSALANQPPAGGGKRHRRKKGGGGSDAPRPPTPAELLGLEKDAEGLVEILDLDSGKIKKKLYTVGAPSDLAFNASGTVLAALVTGSPGAMWDAASWTDTGKLDRNNMGMLQSAQPGGATDSAESSLLAVSPDGQWAVGRQMASSRATPGLWDSHSGQSRQIDPLPTTQLGFLSDGVLVFASRDKPLRFFELPALKEVFPPFAPRR